ncbi:hypothetical protein ACFL56_01540 [Candidatus Margulisiibacteriota bacterium]
MNSFKKIKRMINSIGWGILIFTAAFIAYIQYYPLLGGLIIGFLIVGTYFNLKVTYYLKTKTNPQKNDKKNLIIINIIFITLLIASFGLAILFPNYIHSIGILLGSLIPNIALILSSFFIKRILIKSTQQ